MAADLSHLSGWWCPHFLNEKNSRGEAESWAEAEEAFLWHSPAAGKAPSSRILHLRQPTASTPAGNSNVSQCVNPLGALEGRPVPMAKSIWSSVLLGLQSLQKVCPPIHIPKSVSYPKGPNRRTASKHNCMKSKLLQTDSKRIFSDSSHRSQLSGGQKTSIRSYHVLRKITVAGDSGFTKVWPREWRQWDHSLSVHHQQDPL